MVTTIEHSLGCACRGCTSRSVKWTPIAPSPIHCSNQNSHNVVYIITVCKIWVGILAYGICECPVHVASFPGSASVTESWAGPGNEATVHIICTNSYRKKLVSGSGWFVVTVAVLF